MFVSGPSIVDIRDSILSNNSVQGGSGSSNSASTLTSGSRGKGGNAIGGGLFVNGSGWTVTLTGDTLSGNSLFGGKGSDKANGPNGGVGGSAIGGAAGFADPGGSGSNSDRLTILDDLAAPIRDPSLFIDNSAQGGAGGKGKSGGVGGGAQGGAVWISAASGPTLTANIGNTTFYGNSVFGGAGGAGTGYSTGGFAYGGGLSLGQGNFTMFNNTMAHNTVTSGSYGGGVQVTARGGGISIGTPTSTTSNVSATLYNNTITQNTISGGTHQFPGVTNAGAGVAVNDGIANLFNNLILDNQSIGSSANDLDVGTLQVNASNNFIGSMSANVVNSTSNTVGNNQPQLGGIVGITANGKPSGGPIYFPLLAKTVSVGAGSRSVLNTIAQVEGTTIANATDAIGNRFSASGAIDLGAVQSAPPPSPPFAPPPSPPLVLHMPPLLAFIDSLLGGTETVNANGIETITDRFFGIPLLVATFDHSGDLMSVTLFGFNVTFLFA